jgi:HD domain-containing protein
VPDVDPISRPPLWPLPQVGIDLPTVEDGHPLAAWTVAFGVLGALIPTFLFLAPNSTWTPEDLFVVLLVFAFLSRSAAVRLRQDLTFDGIFIAVLLCLVFFGPLPAAVIGAVTQVGRLLGGIPVLWFLSNVASFTWAPLAGAFSLEALGVSTPFEGGGAMDYAALAVAGVVVVGVNYFLGRLIVDVLHDGLRLPSRVRQDFIPAAPVTGCLIAAGVGIAFLYVEVGIAGLTPLVGVLLLPRIVIARRRGARPVSELERPAATAVYAEAIADALRLDRRRKRVIRDAATHLGGNASLSRLDDFPDVMRTVLFCGERWDESGGFPGLVAGEDIPLESRVLAVAEAWSAQTAKGTRELTPTQALAELRAAAGGELDPRVAAAAVKVVEEDMLPVETVNGRREPLQRYG